MQNKTKPLNSYGYSLHTWKCKGFHALYILHWEVKEYFVLENLKVNLHTYNVYYIPVAIPGYVSYTID